MNKNVERLNPLNCVMFACIFKDMESKQAMLELLNSILAEVGKEPVAEILNLTSEYPLIAEGFGLKYGRVDVMVRTLSGRIFDIEVQIAHDAITNRSIFYGARIISDEFKSGTQYDEMPQVRCINILDFMVREDNEELIQPVSMMFEKKPIREATDVFKIYHIQMPVFRKKFKTLEDVKGNPFHTWLYALGTGYQNKEEMEMLAEMSDGLKNFAQKYNVAINDPKLIRLYRMEQDAIRDENSRLAYARKEGLNQGLMTVATGMKTKGYPISEIAEITGLSIKEINTL